MATTHTRTLRGSAEACLDNQDVLKAMFPAGIPNISELSKKRYCSERDLTDEEFSAIVQLDWLCTLKERFIKHGIRYDWFCVVEQFDC
jgi:hypothetical protein